eukprot:2791511-Pleurochrysis_carterae.AAC.6
MTRKEAKVGLPENVQPQTKACPREPVQPPPNHSSLARTACSRLHMCAATLRCTRGRGGGAARDCTQCMLVQPSPERFDSVAHVRT